jgi:hypothetical protein
MDAVIANENGAAEKAGDELHTQSYPLTIFSTASFTLSGSSAQASSSLLPPLASG